ncbi:uncharacterized protein DS421_12g371750 [Arachis hypogaea]|nr:uncharacterized protein DS421_12g371750 [Arachis hypogaea]
MALRWLVYSTCHVLGYYPIDKTAKEGLTQQEYPTTCSKFQMPLHYPCYIKEDYEIMKEWKVDLLLQQYGLSFKGTLHDKRAFL